MPELVSLVSVIVPARDEAARIGLLVEAVLAEGHEAGVAVEVLVVDDGSRDATAEAARRAGARVLLQGERPDGGNPAAARNAAAAAALGDPLVFLDADCTPEPGWLAALLAAHGAGHPVVGGSLGLPPGLALSARCDFYCGWYHVHPRRPAGPVPNHPPGNLSVRRAVFEAAAEATGGFVERHPVAYAHEELAWQAAARRAGHLLHFEPRAVVLHHNRPGWRQLLRRNYRWGYSALESKAETGAARLAWLYRRPLLLLALSLPLALPQALYVVFCWLRAGVFEPLPLLPVVLAARLAHAAGTVAGGRRWLRQRETGDGSTAAGWRPRWE